MSYVFILLFFVCVFGIFRPFKGLKRWHFGVAAFAAFMLVGLTAPKNGPGKPANQTSPTAGMSPAEAALLEKKNAPHIARLKQAAVRLPASDLEGNLRIYKELSALAPGNGSFSQKVGFFEGRIAARARYEDEPEEALEIDNFDWGTGGFGSVMIINRLTVSNDAPFPIKDFRLRCVHQGNSGTDMDSNTRTVFEVVPANGQKTFRNINMGFISSQAATSRCEITSAAKD